jgi:GNAT superfamily N-acetyltransferase
MMAAVDAPFRTDELTVVPANEATAEDLALVFGSTDAGRCRCQRFKVQGWIWRDSTQEQREAALEQQTACGVPDASRTSGLVAYAGEEPVGWVAVEPRPAYPKLRSSRVPWTGREEDRDDDGVWSVTCFVVRRGFRRRGLTYVLARATVPHARGRGARALEGYPMVVPPGKVVTWGEMHVGARQVFEEAGFVQVSAPTLRRVVMRVDFNG